MERITQASMHPMIQFRVVGYRIETADPLSVVQTKPKPVPIEAKREYHIGLLYPHKPIYEGVMYQIFFDFGAHLSKEYETAFRVSEYTDHMNFNTHQLINCPHCGRPGPYDMIDERKTPGA